MKKISLAPSDHPAPIPLSSRLHISHNSN